MVPFGCGGNTLTFQLVVVIFRSDTLRLDLVSRHNFISVLAPAGGPEMFCWRLALVRRHIFISVFSLARGLKIICWRLALVSRHILISVLSPAGGPEMFLWRLALVSRHIFISALSPAATLGASDASVVVERGCVLTVSWLAVKSRVSEAPAGGYLVWWLYS